MKQETKEIYSELYQILTLLGEEYIEKLPHNLTKLLEEKRDLEYIPQYTVEIPFNQQQVRKETIAVLALIHLNYWCEDEEEKQKLLQMLNKNEQSFQEELREQYNPDEIFKDRKRTGILQEQENMALVPIKENWCKKIIKKIKEIFKK